MDFNYNWRWIDGSFIGPLSFSGDSDLDPLINSGAKVLIAMILIFIWVVALLKIKNWIFRKITNQ